MDVGSINKIKPIATTVASTARKGAGSATDRDAQGHSGYKQQEKPKHLTMIQEEEALRALNELPAFSRSGLKAELVKEEGKAPFIAVRDAAGAVIRHIPYADMIEIYINRKSGNDKGQLLKRAA
ncbi:MAG: hypothetical protein JST16_07375 [Bdellovibrionales bacterium]|nr:hypothetical protein [Bdellovibrionales bacterium]